MSRRLLFLFVMTLWASLAAAKPAIRFDGATVTVTKVTEGGTVLLLGSARTGRSHYLRIVEYEYPLRDDDGDGTVTLALDEGLPSASVWVAIDLASGDFEVASPDARHVKRKHFGQGLLQGPGNGNTARLLEQEELLTFCYVRPGVGAWVRRSEDGGAGDVDGVDNGIVGVPLGGMTKVAGDEAAPLEFQRGDLVIAIAPESFDIFDLRIVP